ncbi:hypothetical protein [Glaciecola sp. SC05]|uniref:hypothetical protein n=1 Tax=Glaciecola sp. SC05 TaxID=1987355 RepID=UPI00352741B4
MFPVLASYAVTGWVIVQVLSIIPQAIGLPDWILTLASVLYIAFFPVVLFVSWYFDITTEGFKLTPAKGQDTPAEIGRKYWTVFSGMLVISIALGFYGFEMAMNKVSDNPSLAEGLSPSIAVLPFTDASAASDQMYLGLGIQEEITNKLSTFAGIKVASTYSATTYAAKYSDTKEIARKLNVANLLTGSVRVNGNRLKVRVEFINALTSAVIWTQSFTREMVDIFAIEEEISRTVVNLLQDKGLGEGDVLMPSKTQSSLALRLYLQARENLRLRNTESILKARELFEQSLAIDSEYANARLGLAQTYLLMAKGHSSLGSLDPEVASRIAIENVSVILPRYPELSQAHATMGRAIAFASRHEEAIEYFDKAIALNPSYAEAYVWRYLSLDALQKSTLAYESLVKAYELDPAYLLVSYNYAREQYLFGNIEKAKTLYTEILDVHPESPLSHRGFAEIAFSQGDLYETAIQWELALQKSPKSEGYREALINVMFQVGAYEQAQTFITNSDYDVNVLIAKENFTQVHKTMEDTLALYSDDKWYLYEAAWYQYLYGEPQKGAELLLKAEPLFAEQEIFLQPLCNPAMELAYAHRIMNDEENVEKYLSGCEQLLNNVTEAGKQSEAYFYLNARISAMRMNSPAAVQALNDAYDNGWLEHWTKYDPLLNSIRNQPEVQDVFDEIDSDLAKFKAQIISHFSK